MQQEEHFFLTKCEFTNITLPCMTPSFHGYRVNLVYSDVQDRIMVSAYHEEVCMFKVYMP